jgi:hypothetical protein
MADAQTWIGQSQPDDKLDLERIRQTVGPEATALHGILDTDKISALFGMRRQAADNAARAQQWFKALSAIAVVTTAVSTLTSGLLLYAAGSDAPPTTVEGLVGWVNDNHKAVVGLQISALFLSAVVTSMLAQQNYVEQWRDERKRAELLRRQIFNEILTMAEARQPNSLNAPDPRNAVAQAFEFFRRYQHELQITFFKMRSAGHGRTATNLSWVTAVLAGLAAITGVLGGFGGAALVASAFLGIAVPILLSAAQSWRASSGDSDKVITYQKALQALETKRLDLDDVREHAALADAAFVGDYVNSVHLILTTENEAWRPAQKT